MAPGIIAGQHNCWLSERVLLASNTTLATLVNTPAFNYWALVGSFLAYNDSVMNSITGEATPRTCHHVLPGEGLVSPQFYKLVRLGVRKNPTCSVYCEIEYSADGKLSITGVEGPNGSGNCVGSCGQICMDLKASDFKTFAEGWDADKVTEFLRIWDVWHLNDLQAGTPEQTAALKPFYAERKYPENDYTHACEFLRVHGLYEVPDPRSENAGKTYQYGHAWLSVPVPAEVLAWLVALPESPNALPMA